MTIEESNHLVNTKQDGEAEKPETNAVIRKIVSTTGRLDVREVDEVDAGELVENHYNELIIEEFKLLSKQERKQIS